MKKQRRGLNRYIVFLDSRRSSDRQHYSKSEAKESHQLSPGGLSNRRKSSGLNKFAIIKNKNVLLMAV